MTQTVLDVAGMIPVIGEVADLANAGIYAARGDYTNAALSAAAAIPFVGWAATGAKFAVKGSKLLSKAGKVIDNVMGVANKVMDKAGQVAKAMGDLTKKAGDAISGALGKVMTKAKGLASNFSPMDPANKLKGKLNDLLMKSPKLANGLKTAGGMATGFMQNLLISETMNYGLEQLSQYVDSDTITKAMILLSMLNSKSKKNQNQGITSNNKSSGDSGSSKPSGDKDKNKKDKDSDNKDKDASKDKTKDKEKNKTKDDPTKPKPKDQDTEDTGERVSTSKPDNSNSSLIDSSGRFKDSQLQSKYDAYVERKIKAGETPKDPLEWKEASEKWASLREQGQEFSDESFTKFSQQYENAQPEITIVTNQGTKIRVDAIATDKDGNIIIQEYKSSATAPYTENQEIGFPELKDSGGKVVGEGKGEFTEGYDIPSGTRVQVVRPDDTNYFDD